MSKVKIKLVRGVRYNRDGFTYEKGKGYLVSETKAQVLLRCLDEFDRPYFSVIQGELKITEPPKPVTPPPTTEVAAIVDVNDSTPTDSASDDDDDLDDDDTPPDVETIEGEEGDGSEEEDSVTI